MCFSATASFTASAVLGATGIVALRQIRIKGEFPLASMPLVFAFQQLIEGFLWLALGRAPAYVMPLTYAFLFFAFLWWPIYAPFMAFSAEQPGWRKKVLFAFCCMGAAIGAVLYSSFLQHPAGAQIINRCVFYPLSTPYTTFLTYWYASTTVFSGLITSRPIIRLFSILLGASAVIAWEVYSTNFTSVWCFFAAIASLVLCYYFWSRDRQNMYDRIKLRLKRVN